jgi:hypothetical protein
LIIGDFGVFSSTTAGGAIVADMMPVPWQI